MKVYQDSKELPLFNYERILETKDYFYMIKGYDGSQTYDLDPKELEDKFNEIIKHYAISVNAKNLDILNYGKIQKSFVEIARLELAYNIIVLKIRENELREQLGLPLENSDVFELMKNVKVPKADNLNQQAKILSDKIAKYQNDMASAIATIEKEAPQDTEEQDINEIITNIELILERTIDMEKTTLYRFGIMQEQAVKKIEQITKINEKNVR